MENIALHTNRTIADAPFMDAVGVAFAEPVGERTRHNDRVVIGTIRILRRGLRVLPRQGLSDSEDRKLRSAAVWYSATGPRGPQWRWERGTGWVLQITVRQASGSRAASARAALQLSSVAGSLSQSSSGPIGRPAASAIWAG